MKKSLKTEKELYTSLGTSLLALHPGDSILKEYTSLIHSLQPRFKIENGKIQDLLTATNEAEAAKYQQLLQVWTQNKLADFEKQKVLAEGKIPSFETKELLSVLHLNIASIKAFQKKLLSTEQEGRRLRTKQHELINIYNEKNKS